MAVNNTWKYWVFALLLYVLWLAGGILFYKYYLDFGESINKLSLPYTPSLFDERRMHTQIGTLLSFMLLM